MKKIRILLISLLVLLGMITFNFWMNSAYYAIHSKYTSQDEVPGIIVDHLDDVMYDVKEEYFGDYFLQVDGKKSINYKLTDSEERVLSQESIGLSDYYYRKKEEGKGYRYNLDKNMAIIDSYLSINGGLFQSHKATAEEQEKVREELNELIKPLLKRVTKPFINLQWLYDFIFREH